ncbi:hypothetical protein Plhal304r1_c059g0147501 [Plasmopara halstedii]
MTGEQNWRSRASGGSIFVLDKVEATYVAAVYWIYHPRSKFSIPGK